MSHFESLGYLIMSLKTTNEDIMNNSKICCYKCWNGAFASSLSCRALIWYFHVLNKGI